MHRDIVCETDYSPLSNAELARQIEWHASAMGGASAYDLERVTGPARALLARVEAAEALAYECLEAALFAEQRATDAEAERDDANIEVALEQANAREAWERVAELEAQLAAQGWRPVTEEPPTDDEYLVWCSSYEGCEIQSYSKRLNRWYSNTGNDADYWQPQPLRPAAAEATE